MSNPRALLALGMKSALGRPPPPSAWRGLSSAGAIALAWLDVDIHGSALPRALHLAKDPGYEPLMEASMHLPEENVVQVDRDEEILRLHQEGKGVKRIARELHHSRKTVTTVIRAMRRLQAA